MMLGATSDFTEHGVKVVFSGKKSTTYFEKVCVCIHKKDAM